MKKMLSYFKTMIIVLAFFVLTGASVCFGASATDEQPIEYYCRSGLSTLENGDALVSAYDKLTAGISASAAEVSIKDEGTLISESELSVVFDAYRRDHPEHFWIGNEYSYSLQSTTVVSVKPTYIMSGAELDEAKLLFNLAVDSMISSLDSGMSEYEKELYLHDKLAENIVYEESDNAHNAYGALVEGKAVCEGYAEALQYLLQKSGIQSLIVLGESRNPSLNQVEAHAWNIVRINGKYYHVDLTWNDQTERTYHAYFNIPDADILLDHIVEDTAYPLPACDSLDDNYFTVNSLHLDASSDLSIVAIGDAISLGGMSTSFYVSGDAQRFTDWYSNNILLIAQRAGVTSSFTYGYSTLGKEVYVFINDCSHDELTHILPSEPSCTETGNIEYYICTNCGNCYQDAEKTVEIPVSSIILPKLEHDFTKKIQTDKYKKTAGDCQTHPVYWHACSVCEISAQNIAEAADKFYTGDGFGLHNISDKLKTDSDKHYYPCTVEGCDHREDEEICHGGNATCTKPAVCEVCKKEYGDTLAHTPGDPATETEPQICIVCMVVLEEATHPEHTPNEDWESDDEYHWHTCPGCENLIDKDEHIFDSDCDDKCDVCGTMREVEHDYADEWYAAKDYHYKKCKCGSRAENTPHTDGNSDGICDECKYKLSEKLNTPDKNDADDEEKTFPIEILIFGGAFLLIAVVLALCFKRR